MKRIRGGRLLLCVAAAGVLALPALTMLGATGRAAVKIQRYKDKLVIEDGGTLCFGTDEDVSLAFDRGNSALAVSGAAYGARCRVVEYNTTATARLVTPAESGTVFVLDHAAQAAEVEFQLPPAAPGLAYTFLDDDARANADLVVQAASGDSINGGTAGKEYVCGGDAVKQSRAIVAIDDAAWLVVSESGTWANDNS